MYIWHKSFKAHMLVNKPNTKQMGLCAEIFPDSRIPGDPEASTSITVVCMSGH